MTYMDLAKEDGFFDRLYCCEDGHVAHDTHHQSYVSVKRLCLPLYPVPGIRMDFHEKR
jgi:hypothetical protein